MTREQLVEKMIENFHLLVRYIAPFKEKMKVECCHSGAQIALLRVIRDHKTITSSELSQKFHMTPGAVTQFIEPLVAEGLVNREKDKNDKRIVHLTLTESGNIAYEEGKKHVITNLLPLFESLTDTEIETLVNLHEKVVTNLSNNHNG